MTSRRHADWRNDTISASLSTRGPWGRRLGGLAVAAALTLLAASNLIDVYGDAAAWASAAAPAALLGCLIALAGVTRRLRLWWQLVSLVFAQSVVGPIVALNGTTIGHVIPTAATLSQGWWDMFGSFKYLIAITPPVGTASGSLMAVWTLALWTAFLAGLPSIADDARLAAASGLPAAAAFAAAALLGTSAGWWRAAAGLAAMLTFVVWLSVRWGLLEIGRLPGALAVIAIAAGLAAGVCLATPQHRLILRDRYEPPLTPYDYTSPLSGMRAYIKDHKDDTVLTVRGLPAGASVRLAVMDRFDGNVWNLSDSATVSGSSNYRRVGTTIADDAEGTRFTATFTVGEGLTDRWLPLAGSATEITVEDSADGRGDLYYNSDTDSAIYPDGMAEGLTYTESGVIPRTPSDSQIDDAEAAKTLQPATVDSPDAAGRLATAMAGGEATGGAAARRIAEGLKDSGWFSHGLAGDYPSPPGHGNYRIGRLLDGTRMVGDSEQYASAMALMARELGLPSRVVLGLVPKNDDGSIGTARSERRGAYTVTRFTGDDVEAWVEIKLDGYGWTAFHPTPEETKVPDMEEEPTPPNPRKLVRQPPVPLQDPLRDERQMRGRSTLGGEEADAAGADPLRTALGRAVRNVAVYGSPVWAMAAVCGIILLVKALLLRHARRSGSPRMRIAAGWRAVTALALQSGIDVHGTRREEERAMGGRMDVDASTLATLAREADYAAFSGERIDDDRARRYWADVDAMRAAMLASLPHPRRWRARLSLAGVFTRRGRPRRAHRAAGIVASMCAWAAERGMGETTAAGEPGARTEGKRS